jgi:hypothetical protein
MEHTAEYRNYLSHCGLPPSDIDCLLTEGETSCQKRKLALSLRDHDCQERLFAIASVSPHKYTLSDLCPEGETVVMEGRNSLPAFSRFEKIFFHPPGENRLWGYNRQAVGFATGPGYYCVTPRPDGVLDFDYGKLPPTQPKGFPRVVGNDHGIGKLVYGGLKDDVVSITRDIWLGRARKGEKTIGYFLLVR